MPIKKWSFNLARAFIGPGLFSFLLMLGSSPYSSAEASKITGTFIQYQSWMMKLGSPQWFLELESMRTAGIDTLVIQWVKSDQTRFYPVNIPGNDPTELILGYADQHQMKVFVGLQFDKNWWSNWGDPDFLQKTAERSEEFGKKLFARYGGHTSFQGWYIPYEFSDPDYDEGEILGLKNFLKKLTTNLRSLSPKKLQIGLSTFFTGKLPPAVTEKLYSEILKDSGVNVLMIQDGVGVHHWNQQMAEKVVPSMNAYRAAAQKNGIEAWSVVESFNSGPFTSASAADTGSERSPTDINRLKEQLQIYTGPVPSCKIDKILTFDFFHYMSPYRGPLQKTLYENYLGTVKK